MASFSGTSPPLVQLLRYPISLSRSRPIFRTLHCPTPRVRVLKTASSGGRVGGGGVYGTDLLRKPVVSLVDDEDVDTGEEVAEGERGYDQKEGVEWVDWEDQILEDTVPLVGFVRMILHSNKYRSGERLSADHEKIILERLLPYHPGYERKIGCGIDYITVGYHPEFERSRCLFIVRKDGEVVDFSYWKCIKGLIRKNYPLYADSFILRHFRRHRRSE